jgi:hypothetical protein
MWLTRGFKEECFFFRVGMFFFSYVDVLQVFNNEHFCWILWQALDLLSTFGVWCVMLVFIYCGVFLLKGKGNGKLVINETKLAMVGRLFWWKI